MLIVDDDRALLSLLSVIFKSAGFEVVIATDGMSALEQVTAAPPAAVILDLEMPGMGGRDFFGQIRARKIGVPVLILSAYNARLAQIELGADAYISKPFDPDDLVEAVRRLIELHPRERA